MFLNVLLLYTVHNLLFLNIPFLWYFHFVIMYFFVTVIIIIILFISFFMLVNL